MSLLTGQLSGRIVDFFFPRRCVGCGKLGDFLCSGCRQKLPRILRPICKRCGRPESSGNLCSACWGAKAEIDGIRSIFRFEDIVRQAIHDLKYRNQKSISGCLAMLMADYLQDNPVYGGVLVPVPLHSRRLRGRGYNQSNLLAQELGKLIVLPVIDNSLCRLIDNLPQARTTTIDERRKNVAGAFSCQNEELRGKNVILIDDVCTSGATLEACAVALKAGGAISVWGLTLAREI